MTIWWLVLILAAIGSAGIAFIWLAVRIGGAGAAPKAKGQAGSYEEAAESDVEHIFNDDFREELRNRGRLHFEKIIGENAMFLQQDLRLTTSQLNEYMKGEITRKLKEEFAKYEQSIMDAKELAIESLQKTNDAIDEQRKVLGQEVQQELIAERKQLIEHFENNMADIVNHYVLAAVGDQIDLSDQLEYILADLEANKKAIIEDIQSGA
jgi:NADH dehydrogenase/NADH:ubiquinone oxidoreductase subunit G